MSTLENYLSGIKGPVIIEGKRFECVEDAIEEYKDFTGELMIQIEGLNNEDVN